MPGVCTVSKSHSPAFKKFCSDLAKRYSQVICPVYEVSLVFVDESRDDETLAECFWDKVYLNATIKIYPSLYAMHVAERYDDVAKALLHEFCHYYVHTLYMVAVDHLPPALDKHYRDLIEIATQEITYALYPAFRHKRRA